MNIKNLPNDIARVDLDRAGETTIFARYWKKGYNTDDAGAPDIEEMFDGTGQSLAAICAALEAQKFSVTMFGSARAQCLRGQVTRVDFMKEVDGWHIKKYVDGWRAGTRPMSDQVKTEIEIKEAVKWCESHGWNVRQTKDLTRAFKGALRPVRNAEEIRRLRAKALPGQRFFDFAYDG